MRQLTPNQILLLGRLILAAIIYLGTMWIAYIVEAERYAYIAFTIFLIKSLPVFGLGINQGLLYFIFNKENEYLATYFVFYALLLFVSIVLYGIFYGLTTGILAALCFLYVWMEAYLKSQKNYFILLYPEVALIIAFSLEILIAWAVFELPDNIIAIIVMTLFFAAFCFKNKTLLQSTIREHFHVRYVSFAKLKKLVLQGLPSYVFGMTLFLFFFIDRTYVNLTYGAGALALLMLAYQFALIASFVVSTLNATSIVDFGERQTQPPEILSYYATKKAVRIFSINLIFLVILLTGVYFFEKTLFPQYPGLLAMAAITGFSLLGLNVFTCIAPILFYYKKQIVPAVLMGLLAVFCWSLHQVFNIETISLLQLQLIKYVGFFIVMTLSITYVFLVLRQKYKDN